jgi:hypothetical protein
MPARQANLDVKHANPRHARVLTYKFQGKRVEVTCITHMRVSR